MKFILIANFVLFLLKQYKFEQYGFDCCLLESKPAYVVSNCNVFVYQKWIYYFVETNEYLKKTCEDGKGSNMLYIDTDNPKILDRNSLNLTLFTKYFRPKGYWSDFSIFSRNIEGFDLGLNLHQYVIAKKYKIYNNQYVQSSLQLFHKGKLYKDKCDLVFIEKLIGKEASKYVKLKGSLVTFNDPIKYTESICSYLFMNAFISTLTFNGIKNTIIEKNQLGFIDLFNGSSLADLNCSIESVIFELYRIDIGKKLLNKQIFKKTNQINLRGIIGRIDSNFNIFDWLQKLRLLVFQIENKNEFVDLNRNWLSKYVKTAEKRFNDFENEKNFIEITWYSEKNSKNDLLPMKDEDFCLFANYPVNKTIFHVMDNVAFNFNCTCTIAYLVQNYYINKKTKAFVEYAIDSNICTNTLNESEFKRFIKDCDYDKRLTLCNSDKNTGKKFKVYLNVYDHIYNVKKLKFIFVIIGQPIASFMGIFFNTLILITLRKRKKNVSIQSTAQKRNIKLKTTFEYIELNSFVNLTASLIFSLQLIVDCIDYSSIYCSQFYFNAFGRIFYIYVINFLGSSLKSSSSLTTLMFSLTRYLMILQKDYLFKCIPFFKLRPKLVLLAILVLSLILSVMKIFFNDRQYFLFKSNIEFDADYLEKFESDYDKLIKKYNFINIVSFVFNDILIAVFTIIIDCLILFKIRSSKSKMGSRSFNMKQLNLNKLIIYNGVFQFLFKLPDMTFNILINYHIYDKWNLNQLWYCDIHETSRENSICLNLLQSAQYFYILSFSIDFFLLYKFNTQFKLAFSQLFSSKIIKN